MLGNVLWQRLAPLRYIKSSKALAPAYKAIELTPDYIKACSSFAVIELAMNIGVSETIYVDSTAFFYIVETLPENEELKLSTRDGMLNWSCGNASGKLALMSVAETPQIPTDVKGTQVRTTQELGKLLELGGLSCNNEALGAIGVYGVVLHNNPTDGLLACSTDNVTLSSYGMSRLKGVPEVTTLPPPGADLLGAVVKDDGMLEFDTNSVIYSDTDTTCYIRQVPPLKTPVIDMVHNFAGQESVSHIPRERITAFIKRADALTRENKRHTLVHVGAADGAVTLAFREGTSTSDEYVLAEDLVGFPNIEPIALQATKLKRALIHIDSIVLDHINENVLTFQGGAFRYIVSGSSPT